MLRFSGKERFPFSRTVVAEKLSDAAFLAGCAPDVEIQHADATTAVWRGKARLSFISTAVETTLTITDRVPDEAVTFTLSNRATGGSLALVCSLTFTDDTLVTWAAEVTARTGMLKLVSPNVLRTQIEADLVELWAGVRDRLAHSSP
jgi:carbon monoxide dehydrogenase subunit G